jgi:phage shock protein C
MDIESENKMKRLYKIEQGKMVSGVCGGVAEYFNIDPSLVRIGWVVIGLAAGAGLLAYIIAAIILPTKSSVVNP